MRSLILLLCLLPGLARADNLYRCVGPAGQVSYQSASCQPGQRIDRTIEFVPDPVTPPAIAAPVQTSADRFPNRHRSTRQATAKYRKPQPSPCARAKARRELQLDKLGLKRTFDDLSRIDAAVRAVCKGY